ncbi:hypothetical protein QNO07_09995 [Streptomyces sp. 549]|uniref:hypothetical protein n=1 Tax=Streptomyces sp. 549 TaxID=3049076 RepID=UPI0024C2B5AA|nr:hypothetical protein [Streptomyces sp. 549]MDK1473748.1 hypothetical protein [Streptomyces sp. 549]
MPRRLEETQVCRDIRVNVLGEITDGEERGRYVIIKRMNDVPSSFLVLLFLDPDHATGLGDYWVESYEALEEFFAECRWEVCWSDD